MASKLEGKVVVVARVGGIGAGIANHLADDGDFITGQVVAVDRGEFMRL